MQNLSVSASILIISINDWFTKILTRKFWFTAMFIFFCKIPKYGQALNNILSPLRGWPTWIGILWKRPSRLTELHVDNECRLARFHAIRKFLANDTFHFSRLSPQTEYLFSWAVLSIQSAYCKYCAFRIILFTLYNE